MRTYTTSLILMLCSFFLAAQEDQVIDVQLDKSEKYEFTTVIDIEASAVKSQGNTGTCWSFSASSFIESEIFRKSGKHVDISEMYNVRMTYPIKAWNYMMRQGKMQFSEGGLAHDVMNSIRTSGLMPESAYSGLKGEATRHDHALIVPEVKKILDNYVKKGSKSAYPDWRHAVDSVLNYHLGTVPEVFEFEGTQYDPMSFLNATAIETEDYVTLTSFMHQPYNSTFILNIPDNFSSGIFYNVGLDQLIQLTDEALRKGYTLVLDCDVSEKTFSQRKGVAFVPEDKKNTVKGLSYIIDEKEVSPEYRQQEFENFNTTDDHLMHIVGMVKDQKGNEYYKVKNSWGTTGERIGNGGYVYMSKPYFRLKTISVLVNKNAINDSVRKELKI